MMAWPCTENGRKQNSLKSITYEFGNKKTENRQRYRWKVKWGRMEEYWVKKCGSKKYRDRNGKSPWEWQGIVTFCTCQWSERKSLLCIPLATSLCNFNGSFAHCVLTQLAHSTTGSCGSWTKWNTLYTKTVGSQYIQWISSWLNHKFSRASRCRKLLVER
jgi:hypothetical protein